jgi:hypothetical protein
MSLGKVRYVLLYICGCLRHSTHLMVPEAATDVCR